MSDHVKFGAGEPTQSRMLLGKLLHTVLAKQALPGFVRLQDALTRHTFCERHQANVLLISSAALRSAFYALVNGSEVVGDAHGPLSLYAEDLLFVSPTTRYELDLRLHSFPRCAGGRRHQCGGGWRQLHY